MPVAATKPTKNLTALRYDSIVRGFVRSGSSSVIQADLARPPRYPDLVGRATRECCSARVSARTCHSMPGIRL